MRALGLKDEKHFRQHYQQAAMALGLIEMTIPDKPRSRLQRYQLTEAGQAGATTAGPQPMKSGISRIRNPVIARVFRELGLTEQWGSGIKRIFESAAQQGLPEPLIEEIATGIRLRIWLAQPHAAGETPAPADDTSTLQRLESRLESRL